MKNQQNQDQQRREFFRVVYPVTYRPKLEISGNVFHVLDISEKGVRFRLKPNQFFPYNQIVQGTLTFHDNEAIVLEGKILRAHEDEIALELTKGIPYKRIVKEQQYLIKNYVGYR